MKPKVKATLPTCSVCGKKAPVSIRSNKCLNCEKK